MEKGDGVSAAQVLPGKERLSASLLTFDNHDFNARYQGIPVGGYTRMVENMLEGLEVRLGEDYLEDKARWDTPAERVVYTGPIDACFGYRLGRLGSYRYYDMDQVIAAALDASGNR